MASTQGFAHGCKEVPPGAGGSRTPLTGTGSSSKVPHVVMAGFSPQVLDWGPQLPSGCWPIPSQVAFSIRTRVEDKPEREIPGRQESQSFVT